VGGGMRQSGILAAAGLFALDNNVNRLKEDHERAGMLAREFADIAQLEGYIRCQTNMIFLDIEPEVQKQLQQYLSRSGISVGTNRWVLHLGVDDTAAERVLQNTRNFFAG
jgi:threonine aldolase